MEKSDEYLRLVAKPVFECKLCSFRKDSIQKNLLFFPEFGYTNLDAPILIIGFNGGTVHREKLDKKENQINTLKEWWEYIINIKKDSPKFKAEGVYYGPIWKLLREAKLPISKNDFYKWVFFSNIIRCPSVNIRDIKNFSEELTNCYCNENNKLKEEIKIISPKIIISFVQTNTPKRIHDIVAESLGMTLNKEFSCEPLKYQENKRNKISFYIYQNNSQQYCCLIETLHPQSRIRTGSEYQLKLIEFIKEGVRATGLDQYSDPFYIPWFEKL